jgi:serine protease AprX
MPTPPAPDNPVPMPAPEHFDPTNLDRTVIATPLLEQMEKEKELVEEFRKEFPQQAKLYNCVILLPRRTKITQNTLGPVQKLVEEALKGAEAGVDPARHKIGPRVPGYPGVFAWLDARTIHRILNREKARLARAKKENAAPIIDRILPSRFKIIIDLNLEFIGQRSGAYDWVEKAMTLALEVAKVDDPGQMINEAKSKCTNQYVFATVEAGVIARLVEMDAEPITDADLATETVAETTPKGMKVAWTRELLNQNTPAGESKPAIDSINRAKFRAIYRIWPDFEVKARITRSISTVKANAAINSFAARGKDITWAVLDTGIQGDHPHFERHNNLLDPKAPMHRDFTSTDQRPLEDKNGHGTHVAGIIAGEWMAAKDEAGKITATVNAVARYQDEHGDEQQQVSKIEAISGMAPECRLVSLKVLDENGIGNASNLIAAIAYVQEINGHGRRILIHGINISIGYDFDPKWFACGQSPLCVEVNQLVRAGVVVVVAAGNTGYGAVNNGSSSAGLTVTINDPGNADLAITVGATHRDMPHTYGVSYFSSKGPTGDGRLKPDLVAPGEKIISCASSIPGSGNGERLPSDLKREVANAEPCDYIETSGTSMAAPHVSGLVAAFLSVRREYINQPEEVKRIFVSTCTDLHRDRYFQGAGLIDLMRAIQSV